MEERVRIRRSQQLDSARKRAVGDLCNAAKDSGIDLGDLDPTTYRRWWLRRPARCHTPTDICLLFGSWDEAKEQATARK